MMNNNDTNNEKKKNGSVTGAVLSLVAFAAAKALSDKETREKIIDTFFEVKEKLSHSTRNTKGKNSEEANIKSVTTTDK